MNDVSIDEIPVDIANTQSGEIESTKVPEEIRSITRGLASEQPPPNSLVVLKAAHWWYIHGMGGTDPAFRWTIEWVRYLATDMVDDISLVMMDREFDSDPVRDTCGEHGVYYLNPKRKFTDENDAIEEMKRNDETVKIIEESREDRPNRKNLFLPQRGRRQQKRRR